jgi:hypothetical protein
MTPNPIQEAVRKWLNNTKEYVGDIEDLTSVCLDGLFDIEELITLVSSLAQTAERERIIEGIKDLEEAEWIRKGRDAGATSIGYYRACKYIESLSTPTTTNDAKNETV